MRIIVRNFISLLARLLYNKKHIQILTSDGSDIYKGSRIIKYIEDIADEISGVYLLFGNINRPVINKTDAVQVLHSAMMVEFFIIEGSYALNAEIIFDNLGNISIAGLEGFRYSYTNTGTMLKSIKYFDAREKGLITTAFQNSVVSDDVINVLNL